MGCRGECSQNVRKSRVFISGGRYMYLEEGVVRECRAIYWRVSQNPSMRTFSGAFESSILAHAQFGKHSLQTFT
jgi:hypothetical protein